MIITENGTTIDLGGKVLREDIILRGPVSDITIRNGIVKGEIRLRPSKIKGNTKPGYTKRARKAAPSGITIRGITFDTDGSTHQLYMGPGSNNCRVLNCRFIGRSKGPCLYLSPEGGSNFISGNIFNAKTGKRREVLAIDGSADNIIEKNEFLVCHYGGIYVYRNCGENGTVRHQKPRRNVIRENKFDLSGMVLARLSNGSGHQASFTYKPYGIIIGSRQGDCAYCHLDNMHDIGSGKSDLDFARGNTVIDNKFSGDWFNRHVKDNDKNNLVKRNG